VEGALAGALRGALAAVPHRRALRLALERLLALRGFDPHGHTEEFIAACVRREAWGVAPESVRTAVRLAALYPGDPGAAAAVLLHHLHLAPGQALAVAAGTPHAHLRGTGVEIMAASDNVVRAGLTSKYVDTAELVRTTRFEAVPPPLLEPCRDDGALHYSSGCADFALLMLNTDASRTRLPGDAPALVLALEGRVLLGSAASELKLERGQAAFIAASDGAVTVETDGRAAVATVGDPR
jgi:mannose-6-phosphate isomerase